MDCSSACPRLAKHAAASLLGAWTSQRARWPASLCNGPHTVSCAWPCPAGWDEHHKRMKEVLLTFQDHCALRMFMRPHGGGPPMDPEHLVLCSLARELGASRGI